MGSFLTYRPAIIPGPKPVPIMGWRGNFFNFLRDPLRYLVQYHREYGEICAIAENNAALVFGFGPAYNRQLLSNVDQFHHIESLIFFNTQGNRSPYILNRGLLTINGAAHRKDRKLMMPAFHRKHVESYHATMVACTDAMLERWKGRDAIILDDEMTDVTLRITTKTIFGLDVDNSKVILDEISYMMRSLFSAKIIFFPFNFRGTPARRLVEGADRLVEGYRSLLATKRARLDEHHDVLTTLIQATDEDGNHLNDEELIGEAHVLFVAGHETSSNALTWTLLLLSQHPAVRDALVDEIRSVTGGGAPSLEHLGRMPLLDRVIKESMRLLPPVVFASRIAQEPFQWGPYELPANARVMFSQYVTHRLPDLYPEPQRFRPERWEIFEPSLYEYFPFGAGSRMCLGATFAQQELKVILAMILTRYRLEPPPNTHVDPFVQITLAPKKAIPMRLLPVASTNRPVPLRGRIREMVELP